MIPEEIYYVELTPRTEERDCYRCTRYDAFAETRIVFKFDNSCSICHGALKYMFTHHSHKAPRTDTKNLYGKRAGALALKNAHKDCCTCVIWKATPEFEAVDF
jgi:hypothetical protein